MNVALSRWSSICACGAILVALAAPANAAGKTRRVSIDSVPRGASVYIGEKESGAAGTTPLDLELPVGETLIIIELENFTPRIETIVVPRAKGRPIKVTYGLERSFGTLVVTLEAANKGARVRIDGEDKGAAPIRLELQAGEHRVEVVARGKVLYDQSVTVSAEGDTVVHAKARPAGARGDGKPSPRRDGAKRGEESAQAAEPAQEVSDDADGDADDSAGDGADDSASDNEPMLAAAETTTATASARGSSTSASKSGLRRLHIAPLFEVGYRYLDYRGTATANTLPALTELGNLLFGVSVEATPVRQLRNLLVFAQGGHSLAQTLTSSQGEVQSVWWRAEASASYRIGLSARWSLLALAGVGVTRHRFSGAAAAFALVPDTRYVVARLGGGVSARFQRLAVTGTVENRPVLSGGVLSDRFRTSSADGIAVRVSAMLPMTDRYFARLDGNYVRYAWSFSFDPAGTYRAAGATDVLLGFSLSAGAMF